MVPRSRRRSVAAAHPRAARRTARWSPDGATVAFVRKAEEGPRCTVCLLPFGPGECCDLTELESVPRQLRFTPSGKRLSYIAAAPDPRPVRERKEKGDDARVFIEDEKHLRLWTLSVASGKQKAVSPEGLTICDYDWLPGSDNRALVTYTDSPRADAAYLQAAWGSGCQEGSHLRAVGG